MCPWLVHHIAEHVRGVRDVENRSYQSAVHIATSTQLFGLRLHVTTNRFLVSITVYNRGQVKVF